MELKWKKYDVHGMTVNVPFFKNIYKLNEGDLLTWDKSAADGPPTKKVKTDHKK